MTPGFLLGLWRCTVLLLTLCESLVRYWLLRLRTQPTHQDRAEWLHQSCRRVLRRLSFDVSILGALPHQGLIVSNHLGYLDILFYGAALPCVFVAKSEVRSWPIFGALAAAAGTVFVERGNTRSAGTAAQTVESFLAGNLPVLLFPEGTSSDGWTVLRFHSSLFEPAIRGGFPVTAAAVRYGTTPAIAERDLCYYGDVRLGPHLFETLSLGHVAGDIRFAATHPAYFDRRTAAMESWKIVMHLRGSEAAANASAESQR